MQQAGWDIHGFHAIVGRGGLVKPIESGIYEVNDALAHDLEYPVMGEHASNLGGLIARDIVREMHNGTKAYIADPVVVDELDPIARLSGHPALSRVSIFHALNQKVIARTYAREVVESRSVHIVADVSSMSIMPWTETVPSPLNAREVFRQVLWSNCVLVENQRPKSRKC